ncbi:CRISPR-associated protein Cas4 [Enhygromyxa salina]|nr:CRISPR-associated protein Cas4 [Enhygromyxa salina]
MCNELVYCERLFHLEHVQGIFVDSADTISGRDEHERAARRGRRARASKSSSDLPPWPELPRSLDIISSEFGVRGKIDFLEIEDDQVIVVETKHGRAPKQPGPRSWYDHELPEVAWPADLAQLGLYMAMLREYGLDAQEGRIFYRGSRSTVTIPWSEPLEAFLHAVVRRAREVGELATPPEPLRDSPKCPGCSLHDVCLPGPGPRPRRALPASLGRHRDPPHARNRRDQPR